MPAEKKKDVENLLGKHFGNDWHSDSRFAFFIHILGNGNKML